MNVFYRIALVLIVISCSGALSAQTDKIDSVKTKGSGVMFYMPKGGLYTVSKNLRSTSAPKPIWTNGGYLFPVKKLDSLSGTPKFYRSDSDFLKVNGPVEEGRPVILSGKKLQANSVDIAITDAAGKPIEYKETEIVFDEKEGQLSIHTPLPKGIYTLYVPVVDGVAVKTVIVQKAYSASWRIKKN